MADDMISNALIWLTMKLINFIAAGDEFPHELGLGIRQKQLLDYWEGLEKQLDVWLEGLPDSFRPTMTNSQVRIVHWDAVVETLLTIQQCRRRRATD